MDGLNLHLYQLHKDIPLSKNAMSIRDQRRGTSERDDDYHSEQRRKDYRGGRKAKQDFRRILLMRDLNLSEPEIDKLEFFDEYHGSSLEDEF